MANWNDGVQIEYWLLDTGTSVATMASFTMRRLSTLGSGDSDSILQDTRGREYWKRRWPLGCEQAGADTHSTFTDLCRSNSASVDEPGSGFLTFLIT